MRPRARRWRLHVPLGASIGLAGALAMLSLYHGEEGLPSGDTPGVVLSECDGALKQVVIHYSAETGETVLPTYRSFLRQLPAGVTAWAVCPSRRDYDDLAARVGATECTLSPVIVDHPITAWSRDRWLALESPDRSRIALLCPREEDGAEIWPAREGDQRVAGDLAAALGAGVTARRSGLYFDGGDFCGDSETVFVRPAVVLRNVQRTVAARAELVEGLSAMLRRRVVVLEGAPDHHVAMYMMVAGEKTVVVGDPSMALRLLGESDGTAVASYLPGGPDFSAASAGRFEAVAERCRAAGYRVVRIPVVPGCDGRTFITYTNVILDRCEGRSVVYMPVFGCAEAVNRAAAETWAGLGYEVRRVECDACARHFGALHCLVNIVRRSQDRG